MTKTNNRISNSKSQIKPITSTFKSHRKRKKNKKVQKAELKSKSTH